MQDGNIDDSLYDHLEQAMAEAENAKREAFQEGIRRGKAEKDAIDAIRRVKFVSSWHFILPSPFVEMISFIFPLFFSPVLSVDSVDSNLFIYHHIT